MMACTRSNLDGSISKEQKPTYVFEPGQIKKRWLRIASGHMVGDEFLNKFAH